MTSRRSIGIGLAVAVVLGGAANAPAGAQNAVYAYPMTGQSPEQQQRDQYECHGWSVQQTGYDPNRPQPSAQPGYGMPPPSSSGPQGEAIYGAARGAAGGAIIGAIAGDAGKGAAIGAVAGTLFGGVRRRNRQAQEDAFRQQQYAQAQYQQQQMQQQAQMQMQNYSRAFAACMSARNYRVQ